MITTLNYIDDGVIVDTSTIVCTHSIVRTVYFCEVHIITDIIERILEEKFF